MVLQSSGQIKLSEIATEYGGSEPHQLSEYHSKGNAPSSGEIQLAADFYGTSNWLPTAASGGSVQTSGDYKIHTFTSSGTFSVSQAGTDPVDFLVVAGGGAGGPDAGGGGGGGGYRTSHNGNSGGDSSLESKVSLSAQNYTVTVGGGGSYGRGGTS